MFKKCFLLPPPPLFMSSVTEIQLNKLHARFRARFPPMIWANRVPRKLCMVGGGYIIGANQARKRNLFNCISVMDDIKINEQNNPIAKGLLYVLTVCRGI